MTKDVRKLEALVGAQEAVVAAGLDVSRVLVALAAGARELTGASGALAELIDRDGAVADAAADRAAVQAGRPLEDDCASARAFAGRELVAWRGAAPAAAGRGGARAVLAAPLLAGDRALGALTVLGATEDAFAAADEQALAALARFGAHLVEQAGRLQAAERAGRRDALTGLGNRRALDECLAHELARHVRYGTRLTLVLVDLDGFKQVNDVHGHQAGDRVLEQVGRRLTGIRGADAAFRLGGDEFALVLPETRVQAAELVARRLVRQLREDTFPHCVGAAWGLAEAGGPDAQELIAAADAELYARKREGSAATGRPATATG